MSKKIGHPMVTLLAVFSILAIMLIGAHAPISSAQEGRAGAAVAPTNTKSAAVMAATAAVLKETSEVRQLAILRPVKSGAQTRAEIERMIINNLDQKTKPEEMRASELALKKLGLVPADFQYRPFIVKLLTEQVAGYYDPKAQQFFLADWIELDGQNAVMVHELTHALQDQHFNLRRFENWPRGDSDAELAAHALIEGDAMLAMIQYVARNPLRAFTLLKSIQSSASSSEQLELAPRALRESLLFPYEHGMGWTTQVFARGGWARVSQAYTDLPQSTEQILHVEKYFAREAPVKVDLPQISLKLGPGWKRIDSDVNGEWSYYLILDQFLSANAESKLAAAGWGGDRYAVYEGPKAGDLLIAQLSVWDTEKDALEFFDAYAKRTMRRYSDAISTSTAHQRSNTQRSWRTGEGGVVMERRGARVLIVEGMPEKANRTRLIESLWE